MTKKQSSMGSLNISLLENTRTSSQKPLLKCMVKYMLVSIMAADWQDVCQVLCGGGPTQLD